MSMDADTQHFGAPGEHGTPGGKSVRSRMADLRAAEFADERWPLDVELSKDHRAANVLAQQYFLSGVAWTLDKIQREGAAPTIALQYHDETVAAANQQIHVLEGEIEHLRSTVEYFQRMTGRTVEYGTRWRLSESAHGPDRFVDYPEQSLKDALETVRVDQEVSKAEQPRGIVVYRTKAGDWQPYEGEQS